MRHASAKAFEPLGFRSVRESASFRAQQRDAVAPLAQPQSEVENLALAARKTAR
jgi:hypothetical protein